MAKEAKTADKKKSPSQVSFLGALFRLFFDKKFDLMKFWNVLFPEEKKGKPLDLTGHIVGNLASALMAATKGDPDKLGAIYGAIDDYPEETKRKILGDIKLLKRLDPESVNKISKQFEEEMSETIGKGYSFADASADTLKAFAGFIEKLGSLAPKLINPPLDIAPAVNKRKDPKTGKDKIIKDAIPNSFDGSNVKGSIHDAVGGFSEALVKLAHDLAKVSTKMDNVELQKVNAEGKVIEQKVR